MNRMVKRLRPRTPPPPPGARLLYGFLVTNMITFDRAAEALHVSHVAVHNWAHARTLPSPANRSALERWTDGKVPATSWDRPLVARPDVDIFRPEDR
jgi:hypothetical protein